MSQNMNNQLLLTVLSFVAGAGALVTLALAVATDSWLYTVEVIDYEVENTTVVITVKIHSGLWRVCIVNEYAPGEEKSFCANIDYYNQGYERVEKASTSMAITRAIRLSAPYPVVALLMIVIAAIISVIGNIRTDVKTLIGAVIYVFSGLALSVGIILYISAVNDEVGHRAKVAGEEEPKFSYFYGWSFFFAGVSFITSEMAAVFGISLYLLRSAHVDDMVRIIPGLEDKVDSDYMQDNEVGIQSATIVL
ncbi:voltage-dependent calcium channel gamma-5 subunit-like isoform X2 [Octopus sinensis]|uniref:Voltage-dependent calcium channel gamma-5 subunit-like isoform X2 n=1 Tax=Octopus sinensis TaxID=2607531 RepID=A0A6P7SUS2_9MOLL|nr:voltage-dependent calcium channel gamma-5 subunit-like isoform X2 [Octopus sinensis]